MNSRYQRGSALWSFFRSLVSLAFTLALLGVAYGAYTNVFGDSREVEQAAVNAACEGKGAACRAQMTGWLRSPIGRGFTMQTPKGTEIVRCQREYIFFGAYHCVTEGAQLGVMLTPAASVLASTSVKPKALAAPAHSTR